GDGGPGPALRLPACTQRRHEPEDLRRHHAGHQLRAGQPHLQPPGPLTPVATLAGRLGTQPDLPAFVHVGLHLAGALPLRSAMTRSGILLFAHGARDPAWAQPFETVADRLRERATVSGDEVVLAFLEFMTPSIAEAARTLVQKGCDRVTVVPLFLGAGGH